jgi:hypothetical protein
VNSSRITRSELITLPAPRLVARGGLDQERRYLAALEAVARAGKVSSDPSEVIAALRVFARPSDVLKRLADRSRKADRN